MSYFGNPLLSNAGGTGISNAAANTLTIAAASKIDQDVSTTGQPTFADVNINAALSAGNPSNAGNIVFYPGTGSSNYVNFTGSDPSQSSHHNVAFPPITGNDVLALQATAQTLTNKTIVLNSNTVKVPYVQVIKNTTQSLTSTTETGVIWDTAVYANTALWTSANKTRFLAPYTGLYLLNTQVEFANSLATRNYLILYKNGSSLGYERDQAGATIYTNINLSQVFSLTAGDYLEVFASSVGGAGTIDSSNDCATSWSFIGSPV